MPDVAKYDNQKDWMAACVPVRIKEGEKQDQAVAVCLSIWRKRNKAVDYDKEISAIRHEWERQHPNNDDDQVVQTKPSYSWIASVRSDLIIVEIDRKTYEVTYSKGDDGVVTFAPFEEWKEVVQDYVPAKGNALKAISSTDDELRVANYIVLFGGRDLEGIASQQINADGSKGEYFTQDTELESAYTKSGRLYVDWEHGRDSAPDAPTDDDVLGYVDWSTAKADARGVWVERALYRHNQYVKWLAELIDAGIVGTSSEAVQSKVKKAMDGHITRWPLRRDTLTVTPMEWRMKTENVIRAAKALGIQIPGPEPEATPKANLLAVVAVRARLSELETSIEQIT